ncbi:GNAT family N-acetyltransferase [Streptomyces sp. 8L]|uniref:GNAT family N-acetyltransferase n=1 Tax=Streptomyces sp. 8L TaxID=2877242 RepID=UPI001CD36931|nr:GNAT family N-acetyltransferase [Streptomyces sp. 8L]MCA1220709.1 GNAT family N-acetyltransferase [Streptomyces sp. 8L]
MQSEDIRLRRAADADALPAVEVWLRSFAAALPGVRRAHTDDEVRDWFTRVVVVHCETWVAVDAGGAVAGLLVLDGAEAPPPGGGAAGVRELEQLYLDPARRGQGLGARFVGLAKRRAPGGLGLWTFQANAPARRFYERHGFVPTELTGGHHNEEREPDIRYVWRPRGA